MNKRIEEIYCKVANEMAEGKEWAIGGLDNCNRFAELLMQAIYDEIKEELIPDELVNIEPDSLNRQYLKGCNGGVTDALYIIKNFGVEE